MEGVYVSSHPLVTHKLTLLRDKSTDSTQFRQLVREISLLLCYEATEDLALSAWFLFYGPVWGWLTVCGR